jgi:hypothetical protein
VGSTPIRLGGRTVLASGDVVIWSVADGRRGRRWRESVTRDGTLMRTVMAETAAAGGRLQRLEVATAAGLLTLHPDADGSNLHGNVVGPDGVIHLGSAWGPEHSILMDGSPALTAIALATLGLAVGAGERRTAAALRIDGRLVPVAGRLAVERLGTRTWRLADPDEPTNDTLVAELDDDDLLASATRTTWPLER